MCNKRSKEVEKKECKQSSRELGKEACKEGSKEVGKRNRLVCPKVARNYASVYARKVARN